MHALVRLPLWLQTTIFAMVALVIAAFGFATGSSASPHESSDIFGSGPKSVDTSASNRAVACPGHTSHATLGDHLSGGAKTPDEPVSITGPFCLVAKVGDETALLTGRPVRRGGGSRAPPFLIQ